MTVPGIGPIISSAIVAAIGTGDVFSKGRDFGAWLGLVPKQISTGDRTILGSISRRGNRYLRALFVQAAWVVLVKLGPKHWERYGLKSWIETAKKRLHHNVLAIALANKPARIAWEQGTRLRVRQDRYDGVPSSVILAPCSGPSRRGLAAWKREARPARRPALTAPARGSSERAGRDEGTAARHEQRNSAKRELSMT
ncbi:hypothetical protein V1289_001842 [Bradyrhizobium sp. AZCC 2289]